MKKLTLAYLAGCMDSDGYFTIRRDSYEQRIGRRASAVFQEQIGLRQVTPQVPRMLHELFGGSLYISKPASRNGRPLHAWHCTSRKAAAACKLLRPYLVIKQRQAEVLMRLQARKATIVAARTKLGRFGIAEANEAEIRQALHSEVKAMNHVGM